MVGHLGLLELHSTPSLQSMSGFLAMLVKFVTLFLPAGFKAEDLHQLKCRLAQYPESYNLDQGPEAVRTTVLEIAHFLAGIALFSNSPQLPQLSEPG